MSSPYYAPSGTVPRAALPIAIACSTAALPAAWAYAWLTIQVPFVFNIFISFGFAICIGLVVKFVATLGKVRNVRWMSRAGTAIGFLAWYCQWGAWLAMTVHDPAVDPPLIQTFAGMAVHPWSLVSVAIDISTIGTLTIGGWIVPSGLMIAIWLVELWIHVMLPALFGRMRADDPFCETSGTWAKKIEVPGKFAFIDKPEALVRFLETNPHQLCSALAPWVERDSLSYAEVVVYGGHGTDSHVSIHNIAVTSDGKGDLKKSTEPVLVFLRLPDVPANDLMRRLTDAAEAGSETEEGADSANPPELATAIEHLELDRFDAALVSAAPYVAADASALRTDANRLCALACSRLGRWTDAVGYWQTLLDEELTAHNILQLATSMVMAGDVPRGVTLADKARALNATSGEMRDMTILTNLVTALTEAKQFAAAMPYLDAIRQYYVDLGVTDPTMLYVRGMPVLQVFLDKSWPIVRNALNPTEGRDWYIAMLPHLDDRGTAQLNEWLENRIRHAVT